MPLGNILLSNGIQIPTIGFGTFKIRGEELIKQCLNDAISKSGYRHIDTASVYRNETDIAKALNELDIDRSSLFITSKLAPKDHGKELAAKAIQKTLDNLNTTYLDLYLIHWPGVGKINPQDKRNQILRNETWKVMEDYHRNGILKSIGVSNYEISHLENLLNECEIKPHVNQIELHPFYQQRELVEYCLRNDIHVTAYSSLGTTVQNSPLLENQQIKEVAKKYQKSSAQILLKWALNKGFSVLPKSTNSNHIHENIQMDFEISNQDMDLLNSLDRSLKFAWDPKVVY